MHPFISVTLYTGQQLVLEGLQRWVTRPCKELESRRQRASLRALAMLLVKTTATGVLAAMLDAAIDYRTRQLQALADEGEADVSSPPRLAGIGMLSRPGVAAWKARLLQAIDEMERRAEQYGLGPSSRLAAETSLEVSGKGKGSALGLHASASSADVSVDAESDAILSRTVQQLQELMRQSSGGLDVREQPPEVDILLKSLLCTRMQEQSADALYDAEESELPALRPRRKRAPSDPTAAHDSGCNICMDAEVRVAVVGCGHEMCFGCARRLCSTHEHVVPACPFCRQPIQGFESVECEGEEACAEAGL